MVSFFPNIKFNDRNISHKPVPGAVQREIIKCKLIAIVVKFPDRQEKLVIRNGILKDLYNHFIIRQGIAKPADYHPVRNIDK